MSTRVKGQDAATATPWPTGMAAQSGRDLGKRCSGIPDRVRKRAMVFPFVFPRFYFMF
jgi:hypothetical protein